MFSEEYKINIFQNESKKCFIVFIKVNNRYFLTACQSVLKHLPKCSKIKIKFAKV